MIFIYISNMEIGGGGDTSKGYLINWFLVGLKK